MKKFILLFIALLLCLSINSYSQVKIGVGIGMNPAAIVNDEVFLPIGLGNFYIPVIFDNGLRLEPEFGMMSYNSSVTDTANNSYETSTSFLRYGIGASYYIKPAKSYNMYFGVRLGIISESNERTTKPLEEYDYDREESQTAFYFGGVVGGEYFLADYFSLGAELQINYISYGEPTGKMKYPSHSEDYPEYKEYSRTYFSNNGIIFARFYFN